MLFMQIMFGGSFMFAAPIGLPEAKVQFLPNGGASLSQMMNAIEHAQQSIDMTYFILNPCDASVKTIFQLLRQKARTVKIRILLDGWYLSEDMKQYFAEAVADSNIEVKFFNLLKLFSPAGLIRSHQKFLSVDATGANPKLITGGRNLTDQYFSLATDSNWLDQDILVVGEPARKARRAFYELWLSDWSQKWPAIPNYLGPKGFAKIDFMKTCWLPDDRTPRIQAALSRQLKKLNAEFPAVACDEVTFISDSPWDRAVPKQSTQTLLDLITASKKEVNIVNYSYIPAGGLWKALMDLPKRNIRTEVITNKYSDEDKLSEHSLKQIEADIAQLKKTPGVNPANLQFFIRPYIAVPQDVWVQGLGATRHFIHAKSWVFDQTSVFIGSFNIDPRSYHTNGEGGVVVANCPAFAKQVLGYMAKLKKEIAVTSKKDDVPPNKNPSPTITTQLREFFLGTAVGRQFL
jgi:putative cardiolipin synthase